MKILLSSYGCSPDEGSEPGVGWHWVEELSKEHELWVLYHIRSERSNEALKHAISKLPNSSKVHLILVNIPNFFKRVFNFRINYEIWQWYAYQKAKVLLQAVDFDIIHHVTLATWWNCGHLWKLPRPFVFGPVSGAQKTPPELFALLRPQDRFQEWCRSLLFDISWKLWSRPRQAIVSSALVFAANPETKEKIKEIRKNKPTILLSPVGVDKVNDIKITTAASTTSKVHFLWAANLTPIKNLGLLLEVLKEIPETIDWELRVAGDGIMKNYWTEKSREYGLAARISFLGRVGFSSMVEQYQWADIFLYPSLRDGTATVLLEAMSFGLPVVALNLNGTRDVLDHTCGLPVPVNSYDQVLNDFLNGVVCLCNNPDLRKKLGEAAKQRITTKYLWSQRVKLVNEFYKEIITSLE